MPLANDSLQLCDPRSQYAFPPFKRQDAIARPGEISEMTPIPDHGEKSYRGQERLKGLNALITGGDSGIGRAVAIAYAREGANVAISYVSEDTDAQETLRHTAEAGVKGVVLPGDIKQPAICEWLVEQTISRLGGIDILVNNAAAQDTKQDLEDWSTELFDEIMKTNVYAPFWLSRSAMKHIQPGGSIINTVSIQSFDPSAQLFAYATSKSALLGMTKAMAELGMKRGIRVNGVAPGPVWTPLIPSTMPAEKVARFGSNTVFGRPAQPVELAPLYVWLASPEASYVSAEVFGATGGRMPI